MGIVREQKVQTQVVRTDPERMQAALEAIRAALFGVDGLMTAEAELALVHAYCNIAPGTQQYPADAQQERLALTVQLGSQALCDIVVRLAGLPAAAVRAELSDLLRRQERALTRSTVH